MEDLMKYPDFDGLPQEIRDFRNKLVHAKVQTEELKENYLKLIEAFENSLNM